MAADKRSALAARIRKRARGFAEEATTAAAATACEPPEGFFGGREMASGAGG